MRDRYPLVKKIHICVGVHRVTDLEQFPAVRIPRPHIRVAFSLWTHWWWKRPSFAIRLSGLFVTSETYVTDLARSSRIKQADEILADRHAFLPS